MSKAWWMCLWAVSTVVSGAGGEPGSPGTATPQPYRLPAPPALPANPQKPPLLRMPRAQENAPLPLLSPIEQGPQQDKQPGRRDSPHHQAPGH